LFSALAAVACLCAAALLSDSALGVSIPGPISVELDGKTSRTKFPPATPKPISMTLEGEFSEPAGTGARVPALSTISLQFDKAGAIFTKGLPTCRYSPNPDIGFVGCDEASLVGQGHVELEIQFPEQPAFRGGGRLLIFNSVPQGRRPVLLYHLYAKVPAPTTFFTSAVIEPGHGRFGTQTTIKIPSVTSGEGSVVGFRATIGKSWTYKGKRVSLLTASCPNGRLSAHAEFDFMSGSQESGEIHQRC
jgi:hypothetical protein